MTLGSLFDGIGGWLLAAHEELLDALNKHCGQVMLSGYANELYDAHLHGWA